MKILSKQSTVCILFLIFFSTVLATDVEGCRGSIQPPGALFYPNKLENTTITSLPKWAIDMMKERKETIEKMYYNDFPPSYDGFLGPYIYYGGAGTAFMFLRFYHLEMESLHNSNPYYQGSIERATNYLAISKEYIDIALSRTSWEEKRIGFLKGRTGSLALASVIYTLSGDNSTAKKYLEEAATPYETVTIDSPFDLDSGMAGMLYAARYLKKFYGKDIIEKSKVDKVASTLYQLGLKYYNKTTKALQFGVPYDGMHRIGEGLSGSGGVIYQLLQEDWLYSNPQALADVKSTINYYLSTQKPNGQVYDDFHDDGTRIQWCHGIPGVIPIFIKAYEVFKEEKYLDAAKLGCDLVAHQGVLVKGMQLCHGVIGNAYQLFNMYAKTKDETYRSKAYSMVLTALQNPLLTDPSNWISYDCYIGSFFVTTAGGMLSFFSDMLAHTNELEKLSMPAFGDHWW
ncbi:lanc-like protein [Anaeramoeba flamelloides]|uniref:Lanc-like protein n=1 Tax=Anaeramoeba flamelloides TaxID=1746091 RepID=A0AAV7YW50_9EUKA|nr:lanc-like protein [Anaeramoeba flamelloides]